MNNYRHLRNPKARCLSERLAFTLVEMLVVISIIVLLAALLMPGLRSAIESVRSAQCSNQLRQVAILFTQYADEFNGYPPTPIIGAYWVPSWNNYYMPGTWQTMTIEMYDMDKKLLQCPMHPTQRLFSTIYKTSYGGNMRPIIGLTWDGNALVTGGKIKRLTRLKRPSNTCWMADDFGNPDISIESGEGYIYDIDQPYTWATFPAVSFRHNVMANFSFFDGHVETRSPDRVPTRQYYGDVWIGTLQQSWFIGLNNNSSGWRGM